MQVMTASSPHELAALRARAYGPRADIATDPAALSRLRELEEAERAPSRELAARLEPEETSTPVRSPLDDPTFAGPVGMASMGEGAPGTVLHGAARRPRPIAAWWIIAWAASVLIVAVVVGAMVFGLASVRPVSMQTGATQIASLDEPVETPPWLDQWLGGARDILVFRYEGLVVARTSGTMFGADPDSECLFLADERGYNPADGSLTGRVLSGCGVREFAATVQFVVDAESPEGLREAFPDGTALQFVLDGDMVGVFALPSPSPLPSVIVVE